MRDLYDVELKEKNGKWRLCNHVFDIPLPWADGLEACKVCSTMLSQRVPRSFEDQEELFDGVVVVSCPYNRPKQKGTKNGSKSKKKKKGRSKGIRSTANAGSRAAQS